MIRVLHVIKSMNHGGAETMIMNIYRNIDRNRIQFDFLCMDDKVGEYDNQIKKMGGRIFTVSSPDNGRVRNLRQIYRVLKEEKIEIIHTHISFYSGLVLFVAYLSGVKKRICHSHTTNDVREINIIRRFYNMFSRSLIRIFANIKLSCGEKAGKYLYNNSNYTIINNGIDLKQYTSISNKQVEDLKKELNISNDEFIIGHVGRFEKVKNQIYFIEFAKIMKKYIKDFKIILVGDGTQKQEVEKKVKKEKLEKYFVFTGVRDDINVCMKMFDIFVMPSLYEGFPLVVVEALAGENICYLSDSISKETDIIKDKIEYFNIFENKQKLVNLIINNKDKNNTINVIQELKDKGYSIKNTAEKISQIYSKDKKG